MTRTTWLRTFGLVTIGLLAMGACTAQNNPFLANRVRATPIPSGAPVPSPSIAPDGTVKAASVGLERFDSCTTLETHLKAKALEITGPYGLPGQYNYAVTDMAAAESAAGAPAARSSSAPQSADGAAAAPQPLPQTGDEFSSTNVQEAGVDEPDLVKTDGKRIFAVAGSTLHAITPGSPPKLAGSVTIEGGWSSELLLAGDRALLFAHTPYAVPMPAPSGREAASSMIAPQRSGTTIHVVDVSNMSAMRVVQKLEIDGDYVSARLTGGLVRVVVRSGGAVLPFTYPQNETPRAQAEAQAKNKAIVKDSNIGQWIPRYRLTSGGNTSEGRLVPCERTYRPVIFSGLGSATVVTIDPSNPKPQNSTSVVGDAQTVYASAKSLYVATTKWFDAATQRVPDVVTTEIHRFDISGSGPANYVASGAVAGTLLNQWSLSEHKDHLRVATTVERPGTGGGACPPEADCVRAPNTENVVTVLATRDKLLVPVGSVGGLGLGERIYAVRYMGDVGYVVTFRQIDPLYTLDLSDPAKPRVVGELKIPGYSAYLHPIGDGKLLGIGQDATNEGRVIGMQASIFDVSNPASPTQLHKYVIGQGHSTAEFDHHAFLWWAQRKLAVLPIQIWSNRGDGSGSFTGAVALRADARDGIAEQGRLSHDNYARADMEKQGSNSGSREPDQTEPAPGQPGRFAPEYYPHHPIQRSLVIGGNLYTVSMAGLMASDLASLSDRGWVSFAA